MRRTFLPFAIAPFAIAVGLSAQTWVQLQPTTKPSLRRGAAMAFDATANRLLLYGGTQPTPAVILGDTWAWNGTNWSQLSVTPLPRWGHQMVRNTTTNRIVTFGGRSPTLTGLANDTFEWTGSAWVAVPTPAAPPARFRYGMAFDSQRQVVVVFGGRGLSQVLNDTWEFDGVTWTQRPTTVRPAPREDFVMAYDPSLARTVVFGGYDPATDTLLGDTWHWDGTTWTESVVTDGPTPRYRATGAFDSGRQRIVMYGGFDGNDLTAQTWEYVGGAWTNVAGGGTAFATEPIGGYDSQRGRFVTFGGVGASFGDETWEFTGGNDGALGSFGTGCPTSAGIAYPTTAVPPTIGTTYTIDWMNLPTATAAVLVAHGVSNTNWSGIPLPFELSILGLPSCNLLVSAEITGVALASGGVCATSLTIPNTPAFVNTSIYSQILIPDPQAPNASGGASVGARSLLGAP